MTVDEPQPRGREAEARRNDARIVAAALDVLAEDTAAPMSAVAHYAGVGQASLYRRYPSKEALLTEVCERGMRQMGDAARAALDGDEPGTTLAGFLQWLIDSGTLRLSGLLGSFTPPQRLYTLAHEVNEKLQALVDRAADAGVVRSDITGADLTMIATQIGALDAGDTNRTRELRHRYLTLALQGFTLTSASELPGPAPDAHELEAPWRALHDPPPEAATSPDRHGSRRGRSVPVRAPGERAPRHPERDQPEPGQRGDETEADEQIRAHE